MLISVRNTLFTNLHLTSLIVRYDRKRLRLDLVMIYGRFLVVVFFFWFFCAAVGKFGLPPLGGKPQAQHKQLNV